MVSPLRSAFNHHVAQTSPEPDGFEVSHGQGIYLYDQNGNAYIDCISGIAVSSLGHSHPKIISAIREQLDKHLHTQVYGEHVTSPQVALAQTLSQHLPDKLSVSYFTNSGAESVEGAIKLAKKYTARYEIIACRHSYHGSTITGDSLRSDLSHTAAARPLVPGIRFIQYNHLEDLSLISDCTAAVIIEPVQGEAGIIIPDPGYLNAVRKRCSETGTLMILDEIQTGMGRTGKMWAFEREGFVPDILLLAKAFGGGLPLGAFISSPQIMRTLSHHPPLGHLTTFGGNALCCAAGLAALQIIVEEKLFLHANEHGDMFKRLLSTHPRVREVRGRGLMMAIDLHEPELLQHAIKACRKNGLLVDWFLFNNRSMRLAPPLVVTPEETQTICEKILDALDTL